MTSKDWVAFSEQLAINSSFAELANSHASLLGSLLITCQSGLFFYQSESDLMLQEESPNSKEEEEEEEYSLFLKKSNELFSTEESYNFKFPLSAPTRWGLTAPVRQGDQDLIMEMKKKKLSKAVPGGKYGFALLLKHRYPDSFSAVPLGKLVAFVKKALEEVRLVHFKTLIFPPSQPKEPAPPEILAQVRA